MIISEKRSDERNVTIQIQKIVCKCRKCEMNTQNLFTKNVNFREKILSKEINKFKNIIILKAFLYKIYHHKSAATY